MDGFVLSVLEGRELGYVFGCFDETVDDVGGPFIGIGVVGIMTDFDIYDMQLNETSPVSCKSEI